MNFLDLSVGDVRCVNGAHLPSLTQGKVRAFLGLPGVLQDLPPPPGGPRKQMAFKILHRLFPPDSIAAALPVEEHLSVAIHPADVSQGGAPGFSPFLPIPGLPAFLAGHKKSVRSFVQMGCRVPSNLRCSST